MGECFLGRDEKNAVQQKEKRNGGGEIEELLLGCHLQSKIPYDISSEVVTRGGTFIYLTHFEI